MRVYLPVLALACGILYGCASRAHEHGYKNLPAARLQRGDAYFTTGRGKLVRVDPVYYKNCARCHGLDGRKITDLTCSSYTESDKSNKSDPFPEFEKTVREGNKKGMPAFRALGEKEIRELFEYFRVLHTVHFDETVAEGKVQ